MYLEDIAKIYQNITEQQIGVPPRPGGTASDTLRDILKKNPQYGGKPEQVIDRPGERMQKAHFEPEGEMVENYYDEVFTILLDEGYSEKEANKLMVQFVTEGLWDNIVKTFKSRTSSLKNVARAGATDLAATAIGASGGSTGAINPPAKPAPIVRQAPVKPAAQPLTIGQIARGVASRIQNATQPRLMGSRTIANLAAGKPGGSLNASPKGNVATSAKTPSGVTSPSGSSSVTPRSSGQVSTSTPKVRSPGGSLANAGPTIDVKPRLSGTPSVQRLSPSQVRNFKPSVSVAKPPVATPPSSGGLGLLKGGIHAAAAAAGLQSYNTGDATLKAAMRRGDYKPQQGPKDPDEGLSRARSFDKAFAKARKSGAKEFTWRSGRYTTKLKGES